MLKTTCILILIATVLPACAGPAEPEPQVLYDEEGWMVKTYYDDSAAAATISQHTVWPHHFITHSAQLNALGTGELDILGAHYAQHPGPLNVRRGEASDDLYAARIVVVRDALAAAGVDMQRIVIADGPAGGDGLGGDHVLSILQKKPPVAGASRRPTTDQPANQGPQR